MRPIGGTVRYLPGEIPWRDAGDGFETAVVFEPGYLDPTTGPKSYGRHGMSLRFLLRGPRGVTQFLMYTNWVPGAKPSASTADLFPMAADLGYHAHVPQYEGAEEYGLQESCDYMADDGPCYYDGSGLQAEPVMQVFIREGVDAVWRILRERHDDLIVAGEASR